MRRALLGVLAAVMVIAAVVLLAIAGWIYAAFGTDGQAASSLGELRSSPSSTAIVIDVDSARVSMPVLPVHGSTKVRFDSPTGSVLVAGSHDQASIDAYLGSRDIDAAYRSQGQWSLIHVPGATPAGSPQSAPDWLTTGSSVEIDVHDGQTVVIANASGAPGVDVDASLRFAAPRAPHAALLLAISGGVLLLAGLALAFGIVRLMRRRIDEHSA